MEPCALFTKALNETHPDWHPTLCQGYSDMRQHKTEYFNELKNSNFYPSTERLLKAFSIAPQKVKYIIIGESPYPRQESANGYAFMDANVGDLFSPNGLSKAVNRATSLRNLMKLWLICEGRLNPNTPNLLQNLNTNNLITTQTQLQENLLSKGFLLLNTALVYRDTITANKEASYWQPLLKHVLRKLAITNPPISLLLWGSVAQKLESIIKTLKLESSFDIQREVHPYNISFIHSESCYHFFKPLHILRAP